MAQVDNPSGTDTMGRPRHRLFAIFNDPAAGLAAVEELHAEGHDGGGVVVLKGEEGCHWLDVTGRYEGLRGRVVRLVEHAMSGDIDYLHEMEASLEKGGLVIVVPVPDVHAADDMARMLRQRAGHSCAYFASWGFQPVSTT